MAKFKVTVTELQSAITDLTTNNGEFKSRVAELETLQQELASMWQGDANTAFNTAFSTDKGKWDAFATLIDNYVTALSNIKTAYEQAEATNTSTAKSRSV